MNMDIKKQNVIKIVIAILCAVLIYFAFYNRKRIMDIASPVLISLLLAYLLNPVVCWLEKKGIKRVPAIILMYLFLGILLVGMIFYIVPELIRDSGKFIDILPGLNEQIFGFTKSIQDKFAKSNLPYGFRESVEKNVDRIEAYLTGYIASTISYFISFLSKALDILLIPFLLYYFLRDYNRMGIWIKKLIPRKYRDQVIRIGCSVDDLVGSYIKSQLILSGIIAVLTTLTLLIIKVDFALILGIINGIANIIPYFGPFIGGIPAIIIALLDSPLKALYTLIAVSVIQEVESGIISPKLTSDSVDLHPVTVMVVLIIGGEMFGMTGMILSVPVAAAIKVVYSDLTKNLF